MEYVSLCPAGTPIQWPTAKELERYCQEKDRELEEAGEKVPEEGTGSWKALGPTACDWLHKLKDWIEQNWKIRIFEYLKIFSRKLSSTPSVFLDSGIEYWKTARLFTPISDKESYINGLNFAIPCGQVLVDRRKSKKLDWSKESKPRNVITHTNCAGRSRLHGHILRPRTEILLRQALPRTVRIS